MATSSGASASRIGAAGAALAAAAALLVFAAPAAALDRAGAIAIAASDPAVGPLQRAQPRATFRARLRPGGREWLIVLRERGGPRLARFVVADATGAVTWRDIRERALPPARLRRGEAGRLAAREPPVREWLRLYDDTRRTAALGDDRVWTVRWYAGSDQVAQAQVDDESSEVGGVRTGPQVEWMLARGDTDTYGRLAASPWVFGAFAIVFLAGLVNWRRPVSMRTLDMLALVSLGASFVYFTRGETFVATPLVYPPLAYLALRMAWVAWSGRPRQVDIGGRHALVLVALLFGLVAFRLGLNYQDSNVLDVGYAGVVGADRILDGRLPYGNMPARSAQPCGGSYADGDPIGYVQATSGRCESVTGGLDTYGPSIYLLYAPAVAALGWSGLWTAGLPAAHAAAVAFDLLAVAALFAAGWRFADARIGVLLAFGWAANPFTLLALNMNANDAAVGALLALTVAALPWPALRGVLLAVAALTKFAPLLLLPLFAALRGRFQTLAAFTATSLALLAMLALEGDGLHRFWDATVGYQLDRVTPLSVWTLSAFRPGWPDLGAAQTGLQVGVAVAALAAGAIGGRRDAAHAAAAGAALVIAAQAAAGYWFYPYVCWWLPLVLLALFLPRGEGRGPIG